MWAPSTGLPAYLLSSHCRRLTHGTGCAHAGYTAPIAHRTATERRSSAVHYTANLTGECSLQRCADVVRECTARLHGAIDALPTVRPADTSRISAASPSEVNQVRARVRPAE